MKYAKEQKEGIARFLDTIAASAVIGAVVGTTGHSVLSAFEITVLLSQETNMITAVVIFTIIAALVTWYVDKHSE